MKNNVLEIKDFSFKYNQAAEAALENVSFTVEKGSFFCIIGENGSGKSTLCNALVGLIPHYFLGETSGEVLVDGIEVKQSSVGKLSQKIGLVFQNPFNQLSYAASTVAEELAYGLGHRGIERADMKKKIEYVSRLMRLNDILERNPLELSGGQVQRVAFGSMFILEPEILVLDECTAQLDPIGAEEIFSIVKELNKRGITVVAADHDMERVAKYADTVLMLRGGRVVKTGSPQSIFCEDGLNEYGIDPPAYVKITRELGQRGYTDGTLAITEEPTIKLVAEALIK